MRRIDIDSIIDAVIDDIGNDGLQKHAMSGRWVQVAATAVGYHIFWRGWFSEIEDSK